jgi:signal transduction histidine kinase
MMDVETVPGFYAAVGLMMNLEVDPKLELDKDWGEDVEPDGNGGMTPKSDPKTNPEINPKPDERPRKTPLTHSMPAKVIAFFLLVIMACVVVCCVVAALFFIDYNFYTVSISDLKAGFSSAQPYASVQDPGYFSLVNMLVDIGFALRYWVYAIGVVALALAIASFVFLLCAAGHRRESDEITGIALGIPFDLLTGALLFVGFLGAVFMVGHPGIFFGGIITVVTVALMFITGFVAFTAYCMSFAARVKRGKWWRNTVIYRLATLLGRACMALGRNLPLIWKTVLIFFAVSAVELFGLFVCWYETDILLILWFLEKLLLLPAVLYLAIILRRLQKGGQVVAQGNLSSQIDTQGMFGGFRQHGEHLNNIALGMTRAVDERLKSERLKTELITNVSHDIKTPLTSIINYSDLICREPDDTEKVREYAEVLHRQSERLKKLMEGLIEASKASTGNVEILLAPCEVGVLIAQTVGEYEQRAHESGVELIAKQPERPVRIMADGRHLWRVFDNLMSNICKYAQSGTRAYLTIEESGGEIVISFKNISCYALDISAQELMERFIRGDNSRTAEGNGLGLSIAQSLTELQNGRLELSVDGDLFKAILHFRSIA